MAAVLIGITLILVIAARVTDARYADSRGSGRGRHHRTGVRHSCLVIGVAVGVLFPEG